MKRLERTWEDLKGHWECANQTDRQTDKATTREACASKNMKEKNFQMKKNIIYLQNAFKFKTDY